MALKVAKPTSPGRRGMSVSDFSELTRSRPERSLVEGRVNKSGGRNGHGRTTVWQRGGGHKRRYRRIDFRREKAGVPARVASIEYDPNRSANIALLHYRDGEKRYIVAPLEVRVGDELMSGPDAEFRDGQWEAIEEIVVNRGRALVVQRTGWGKSAVYFIATRLLREAGRGPTLIVSPLLALMNNQIDMAEERCVKIWLNRPAFYYLSPITKVRFEGYAGPKVTDPRQSVFQKYRRDPYLAMKLKQEEHMLYVTSPGGRGSKPGQPNFFPVFRRWQ